MRFLASQISRKIQKKWFGLHLFHYVPWMRVFATSMGKMWQLVFHTLYNRCCTQIDNHLLQTSKHVVFGICYSSFLCDLQHCFLMTYPRSQLCIPNVLWNQCIVISFVHCITYSRMAHPEITPSMQAKVK